MKVLGLKRQAVWAFLCACSPCVCMGSFQVLLLPPTGQKDAGLINWWVVVCLYTKLLHKLCLYYSHFIYNIITAQCIIPTCSILSYFNLLLCVTCAGWGCCDSYISLRINKVFPILTFPITYPCSQAQREQSPLSFTHQLRNRICYHGHKLLQLPIVLYVPLANHFPHHCWHQP